MEEIGFDLASAASGAGAGFLIALYVIVGAAFLGIIGFVLYRMMRNNVVIYVRRGGKQYKYRGRETSDKTGKVLGFEIPRLPKYSGRKIPEEYFYDEVIGVMRNKTRKAVDMKFTEDGNLVPIKPAVHDPEWETMSNPQLEIYTNLRADAQERFDIRNFWDKYGAIIMTGGLAIIIMVTFIIAQDFTSGVVEQAGAAANSCTNALATCQQICNNAAASAGGSLVV